MSMISPQPETPKVSLDTEPRNAASILDRARDALNARMTKDNLLLVLENVINYAVELEAEREKLVRWHGEDGKTINRLVARVERRQAELVALRNDALNMRGSLAPADGPRKVPFELGETLAPAVDWLIARVAELEAKAATARTEAIADVGDWLDEHGEKNAAHLVYTCDIPAARDMVTHVVADDSDDPEHVDDCPGCKTQQTGGDAR